ncbi:MAG: recombination protein RecR [Candidatus Moranbacteria bacterium RIFCSPHIGHO2_12_FULL_40_10]|nr:MAG: recombination protein RecR [Candidatus Moranbacteria bacterium RIFCSPHIGHO2_12_FULL_40_10]
MMYPKSFKKLIDNFSSLPSVGPKMAERLVLHLFKQDKKMTEEFSENLKELKNLKSCQKCFNIAEGNLCEICKNTKKEQKIICVVEEPLDIISIEKTGAYRGLYHVLGGTLDYSPDKQVELKIPELLGRIKNEKIKEVIIATNPTTEGDATALYLKKKIKDSGNNVKISRLAKGLATGGDIEYADEATLSAALTNRREMI